MSFTWLHFTDLHWGSDQTKTHWGNVEQKLFEDLTYLTETYKLQFDLILFSGDMVNRGTEYTAFNAWLQDVQTHLAELGSHPQLLAIPGNHDLERPKAENDSFQLLQLKWDKDSKMRDRIWKKQTTTDTWKLVRKTFANYTTWQQQPDRPFPWPSNAKPGLLPGDFAFTLEKDGHSLGIIGLNTAMLHLADGSQGQLELNAAQLVELCGTSYYKWCENHDFCLIMTHHPVAWLSTRGREAFNDDISPQGRFLLHFCGHMHESAYHEGSEGFHAATRRTLQGNSLFSREPYKYVYEGGVEERTDRRHGYSIGQLALDAGRWSLRVWPRTVNRKGKFVVDTDLCEQGESVELVVREDDSPPPTSAPEDIRKLVEAKILDFLNHDVLQTFRDFLPAVTTEILDRECALEQIPGVLCGAGISDALVILELTYRRVRDESGGGKLTATRLAELWERVWLIAGWLVLLTVDKDWLAKHRGLMQDRQRALALEMDTGTVIGIEAAIACLELRAAEYTLDETGRICGQKCLHGDPILEPGMFTSNTVTEVKKKMYKILFRREAPSPYTPKEDEELNALLLQRNKKKKNHYIVLGQELPGSQQAVYEQLRKDLPELNLVLLKVNADSKVLVISDKSLNSYLWEFLQANPTGRGGQEHLTR